MVPSYPPPPNIIVLRFQPAGMSRRNLMSGADGSFGRSAALTPQYSMARPLTVWVTKDAVSTRPPRVGRLITDAGIATPANSAHLGLVLTGVVAAAAGTGP